MNDETGVRTILGLLGDKDRFRVAAAVALGSDTAEKIVAMTGLENRAVIRTIGRLESVGLIERQAATGYGFRFDLLADLARNSTSEDTGKTGHGDLDRFFCNGQLLTYPSSNKDRLLVLEHIASEFEYDRRYSQQEVNEGLKIIHPDFASLRRYLVDARLLARENIVDDEGRTVTVYWRMKENKKWISRSD
ncbi:MAG: DUF2087 domain-containing protein [Dehalococcoidales bacterium]|nr:DUF2087 domain-containing protein [Dehalococcoidales bacterium]